MKEITALLYNDSITEEKAAEKVRSVYAAIALARTNRFRKVLCEKGGRPPARTALNAAGTGTIQLPTRVPRTGTTITGTTITGTTTSVSASCVPSYFR